MTNGAPHGLADLSGIDFSAILPIFHEGVIVTDAGGTSVYYNDTQGRIDDLPPQLVEAQVAKAPSEFTLYARNPEKNVVIGGDNVADWTKKGGLTMEQGANREWKEIFEKYEEPALPGEVDKALKQYIEKL